MTIRIDRRLYGAIKRYPGSIIIAVDTSDPEQATAALRRARSALLNLGQERSDVSLRFVGQVVPGPSGPMLWLDGGGAPSDLLALIPDILRDYLAGAGVDDATLTTAASESLEAYRPIGMASPCLTLRLFPDPPATGVSAYSTVPADWIAAAIDWLNQETQSARHVTVRTAVPFAVETSAVSALLSDAHRAKVGEISIMTGQTSTRLSVIQGYFGWGQIALSTAGPDRYFGPPMATADAGAR